MIAASTNERVEALALIAALAPDVGETIAEMFYREEPHPQALQLAPDAPGFIWMPQAGIRVETPLIVARILLDGETSIFRRLQGSVQAGRWRSQTQRARCRRDSSRIDTLLIDDAVTR